MQRKPDYTGADAASGDFAYMMLDGVSFSRARLIGATFRGTTLSAAKFVDANLCHVDFRGARLVSADLRLANLSGADLSGANLIGADLRGTITDEDTRFDEQTRFDRAKVDPGSLLEQAKLGRAYHYTVPHPEPDQRGRTVEFIGWQEREHRFTTE